MKVITIILDEEITNKAETKLMQSIKKLLAEIAIKHRISSSFITTPRDETTSSLKLEHVFRDIAARKVLEITARGLIKPSEDSAQWEKVEKYLEDLVDRADAVIVNIANVPHVDSVGLGVLVTFHTFLQKWGIQLIFVGPNEKVRQKLRICRLDTILHIVGNNDLAYHDIANSF